MRKRINNNGLTVNLIAGTRVVFFGLSLAPSKRQNFRGFAFKRFDHKEGESVWLRGLKTFRETEPHPATGEMFSTRHHPIQGFQWADYGVEPGRDYTYTIVALYGDPSDLAERLETELEITTETETGSVHSVFFNRGSVASQEYARHFQNQRPSEAGPGAYEWLSRGLLEALVAFLGRAKAGWEVYGAIYEFQWPAALAAVREARQRGANVKVLYDDIEAYESSGKPKGPWLGNREAIKAAHIKSLCEGRKHGKLMHNKFFVLSRNGRPKAVWTGSTNLTENGIFGHSNLGHIVEDETVAQAYLDYWRRLEDDPSVGVDYRDANVEATPAPPEPWGATTTAVFSPRGTNLDSLNWYAQIAGSAEDALFMTFAFGMHKSFKDVYRRDDGVLRMALLEKVASSPQTAAQDEIDIQEIRNLPNVVVAIGNRIKTNSFDRWLAEIDRIITTGLHVYWIHTKYMLVDPLGERPIVVSGSANFSKASTDINDENMLVIRGDKRIADIYFGEYLRLYTHYAFRESVKRFIESNQESPEDWQPQYLINNDDWMTPYFDQADISGRNARRKYFAGPMAANG
jgi:phosphatidylserine/phosphatidylglycerophosphate/cardiolipin synthase-like enzyme